MNTLSDRQKDIEAAAARLGKPVYASDKDKIPTPRRELQQVSPKLVSLEEAIKGSGLKDGMTISFHHHFRGGDKVVNLVVDKLAEMGYKNLHLAASSLSDVHAPLLRHIQSGVITRISTSGLRGELAKAIRRHCRADIHALKTPSQSAARWAMPSPTPAMPTRLSY